MNENLKLPKNKAQVFPQPYPSAACDVYGCISRAKWFIGKPDGPLSEPMKVCDECMKSIVRSLPEEYLELVPKVEHEPSGKSGEPEAYVCPNCGREFDKPQGLSGHLRHCKAGKEQTDSEKEA